MIKSHFWPRMGNGSCAIRKTSWVRQSTSRSRSTPHPQVKDQSLFDEHERCSMRRQQWETTVRLEMIATWTAVFGEEHAALTPRRSAEIPVFGAMLLGDDSWCCKLALATSGSFQTKSASVFVFGWHSMYCVSFVWTNCCSAQCVLCRRQSAHQVLVVVVPSLVISLSCARDCVFMTRDMLLIMAQENLMCSSRPTLSAKYSRPPGRWENTLWERFRWPFKGPVIPGGAMVEYRPISEKNESSLHQFG